MVFQWVQEYTEACVSDDVDCVTSLFEFISKRVRAGRRISLSAESDREDVLREMALELRTKPEAVSSFVKEWMDQKDDPNGIILDTPAPVPCTPSSSSVSSSVHPLLSWDTPHLGFTLTELVSRSYQIFPHVLPTFSELVDGPVFSKFVKSVSHRYRGENRYHNFHHAHSVLAITGNLLTSCVPNLYTPIEEFAILTAALCHDIGHRGLNSDFYIKTRHSLAEEYNDISVLENMHCSLSFELIRANGFAKAWPDETYVQYRKVFIQSILATDMKSHFDLTGKLMELSNEVCPTGSETGRKTIYCAIVHAADLSNSVMPTAASYDWAYRVVEEMHAQGKLEAAAQVAVTPFMKHPPSDTAEFVNLQLSFIAFIVSPLWKAMAALWPTQLADRLKQLETNTQFWEQLKEDPEKNRKP